MTSQQNSDTVGVILAGGESRRMGVADKCLLPFREQPLLEHVIARAKPQVAQLLISANGDPARFRTYGLPIVADLYPDRCGPLAGIISAMAYSSNLQPPPKWLATFPCDAPLSPLDWVSLLKQEAANSCLDVIVAADVLTVHYTFALWSCESLTRLQHEFAGGQRALYRTSQALRSRIVVCDCGPTPFTNINTPGDLQQLNNTFEPPTLDNPL